MRGWEAICGALAVIVAATVAFLFYRAGSIAPDFVRQDLMGLGIILGAVALGLILDVTTSWLVAKLVLAVATLALWFAAALSFDVYIALAALLAIAATLLAFVRQYLTAQQRTV